jgi:hypothetical protein
MAINANSLVNGTGKRRMRGMRPFAPSHVLLPLFLAATTLAACDEPNVRISSTSAGTGKDGVLNVVEALQCPETQGVLTRKGSAQPGGKVCTYTGPKGAEVNLHLVDLNGDPSSQVLLTFEHQLAQSLPQALADIRARQARDAAKDAANNAEARAADAERAAADADKAAAEAESSADDTARVRLPGVMIDAHGDKARVRIGGLSINADDTGGTVNVRSDDESVDINATDNGAEVRTRGAGDATRTTWMLTDNHDSNSGWRMVGYEARGPAGGPIVIATVRTKDGEQDAVLDAAKALVTLNVGR